MTVDTLRERTVSLFYILLGIFPFGLGVMVSVYHYSDYPYFGADFFLVVLCGFGFLILISGNRLTVKAREIEVIAIAVLMTLIIRRLAILFFNTQPVSDFQYAVESARLHLEGPSEDLYMARFPYWGFYILTLTSLFRIIGATVTRIKLFNILLSGLTTIGVYYLGKKVTASRRSAVIASLLYAFWPAEIMYKNLPTGEHIFAMLFPYACLLFVSAIHLIEQDIKRSVAYLLICGLILGLMDLYKPVGIVLLIAFGIAIFFMRHSAKQDSPKFPVIWSLLFRTAMVIGLVFPYWAIKEIGYLLIEYEAMAQTNRYGFGPTLRVGLDPDLGGRVNQDIRYHIRTLLQEHDQNYQLVDALLLRETAEIIKTHSASEYLKLFADKFCLAWCSEYRFYDWATSEQLDNGLTSYRPTSLGIFAGPWSDAYYILLLIFSLMGSLYYAIDRKDNTALPIGLFIFGFALLLLASEVQPRYRSVVFPSIPIFAAHGISAFSRLISWMQRFVPAARQETPDP